MLGLLVGSLILAALSFGMVPLYPRDAPTLLPEVAGVDGPVEFTRTDVSYGRTLSASQGTAGRPLERRAMISDRSA
jgi:hypothetical protein